MLPKLADVLSELGQLEADQIAERFNELGIKGFQGNPCQCPVAHYLESIYGDGYISVSPITIRADWQAVELDEEGSITRFIIRFDNGKYEGLIDDEKGVGSTSFT